MEFLQISVSFLLSLLLLHVELTQGVCAPAKNRFVFVWCYSDLNVTGVDLYDIRLFPSVDDCLYSCHTDSTCASAFFDNRYNTCAIYRPKSIDNITVEVERRTFFEYLHNGRGCGVTPEAECYVEVSGKPWYSGRKATTVTGRTCQRFDQQHPHEHYFTNPDFYPDDTISDAENFCRNPDRIDSPWCYTMDETVRYEFCGIPRCP